MTHEVEITGLANGGGGICRIDGQICFVPYALPGDKLAIELHGKSQGALRGAVREIVTPSPHRSRPSCRVFGTCGGCTWLHFDYPAQAEWKRRIVKDCFSRIGKLDVDVDWLEDAALQTGYRTRATFRRDGNRWGFLEAGSHDVVDTSECPLCHPQLNAALSALRSSNATGPVEITVNPEGDEVLVWSEQEEPSLKELFPLANSPQDAGRRESFLFDGVPIVNGAFAQSSLLLNRVLAGHVHAQIGDASSLLDLYCGTGNFSLTLTDSTHVVGIDHDGTAIMAAGRTDRGEYRVGDETEFKRHIGASAWDVIMLDPPRTGAKRIMRTLAECRTGKIIYVSCDPATLARDAAILVRGGWAIDNVTAVDMFPNTVHIECVVCFERAEGRLRIET